MTEKQWPAAKVEMRKVSELIPYANNSRVHSEQQVGQIAASINEWGWTVPVLIDEKGMLIAGHGRILAAQKLGLKEVPAMTAKGWTEAQKKAYVIADNQLGLISSYDYKLLQVELEDLQGFDFDLDLLGFGDELDAIMDMDSDWGEGVDVVEKDGEHLEGIKATIKISLEQEAADLAARVIETALSENGIPYEVL